MPEAERLDIPRVVEDCRTTKREFARLSSWRGDAMLHHQELTKQILGTTIQVHMRLGPGLFESAYDTCFGFELGERKIPFQRQVPLEVTYSGVQVDCAYRLDYVVDGKVVVELKSVNALQPVHIAQLLTYVRMGKFRVGLLINFNVAKLKDGIVRRVYG